MKHQIICTRFTCKNNNHSNNTCKIHSVCISCDGCESFEKGFAHYTNRVWNVLKGNMIHCEDVRDDERIGIYYICRIFDLTFSTYHRGDWVWYGFSYQQEDGSYSNLLTKKEICEREVNKEAMMICFNNFNNGILPDGENEELFLTKKEKGNKKLAKEREETQNNKKRFSEAQEKTNTLSEDYGFISPSGYFIDGDWGLHEETAFDILLSKNWEYEYRAWQKADSKNNMLARDFLINQKNYCLIHSPAQDGIVVTYNNRLTKHQRNYLFDYFAQRNDYSRAFLYGVEEEK